MKIAVSASSADPSAPIDRRFGRATGFMLLDTVSNTWQFVDNSQNFNAPQGAGIQAAETVSRLNADLIITGHCGPKAFAVLKTAGIQVVTGAAGTVSEAVAAYQQGHLQPSDAPDVDGHWV